MGKPSLVMFSFAVLLSAFALCQGCPTIVSRTQWKARNAKSATTMKLPVAHVFIHHTVGRTCTDVNTCAAVLRQTQNFHMDDRKWTDIGYSFLVGGDGKIYEGRGWNRVGAHTVNYNSISIGISFMGNYQDKAPNNSMLKAARDLIECGVKKGFISKTYQLHGHRDASCTACPGQKLYEIIKTWNNFKAGKLSGYKC